MEDNDVFNVFFKIERNEKSMSDRLVKYYTEICKFTLYMV